MPCLPAGGVQHIFESPPQAWAAHLQQLKASPADTDITAGHSAAAGTVAKAQLLSAPASSAELVQERQQQQQEQQDAAEAKSAETKSTEAKAKTLPDQHGRSEASSTPTSEQGRPNSSK